MDVEEVFLLRNKHSVLLSCSRGRQTINCHFFHDEVIEFDLDPRDVEDVTAFLTTLGFLTGKPILLTEENAPEYGLARYNPATDDLHWVI